MNHVQNAGRRLLAFSALLALAACLNARPTRWTLWYIPTHARSATPSEKACQTYVFATPGQTEYAVAVAKGWTNPPNSTITVYSGEDFSGSLELGPQTIHDQSNGHDLNVDVIYKIRSYVPAKLRADSNCGLSGGAPASAR